MDWSNLIIQLGISGLVLYVVFRIGMKSLDHQSKADSERTQAMREGFAQQAKIDADRTIAIREGFAADINAHNEITKVMQTMQNQNYRMEAKLDTVLDLTPVRGIRRIEAADLGHQHESAPREHREHHQRKSPSVIVDMNELEDDTPVDRPTPTPTKTPRAPSAGGIYGLRDTPPPKNKG